MKIVYKKAPEKATKGVPAHTALRRPTQHPPAKIDPWKINVLTDGSQAKIVRLQDGSYILGIVFGDRSALEVELETRDRSKAEQLAAECIRLYNEPQSPEAGGTSNSFRAMLKKLMQTE
jgi:hypothetical protein